MRGRGNEDGHKAVAERRLLFVGYGLGLAVLFGRRPALGHAVFQIDNSCGHASALEDVRGGLARMHTRQPHGIVLLRLEDVQ